jgi:hypothetical protein
MLGTHRDVATFTESHLFPEQFWPKLLFFYRIKDSLPSRIAEFLKENELADQVRIPSLRTGLLPRSAATEEARKCLELLDEMALAVAKTTWLEKTPRNLHRIALLKKSDPNIEVIHIVREPGPVVSSLHKASLSWGVPVDHSKAANRWLNDVKISISCQGREKHHFVLYEDLARNPEKIIAYLIRRLGLDPTCYLLDNYKNVAARVTTPQESWKANNTADVGTRTTVRQTLAPEVKVLIDRDLLPVYQQARDLWGFQF